MKKTTTSTQAETITMFNVNIQKIATHNELSKLLKVNEITKLFVEFSKKDFAYSVKLSDYIVKVFDNYKDANVKKYLLSIGIKYSSKYDYMKDITGYSKSHVNDLVNLTKVSAETMEKFMKAPINKTIKNCLSFAKIGNDIEQNTTATAPKDTTKTETTKKLTTEQKHIETKIGKGASKVEAMEMIKKLMETYEITVDELK